MKVKVKIMFWDKYKPNTLYKVNDILDNISEKRYDEIKHLVEIVEKNETKNSKKERNNLLEEC